MTKRVRIENADTSTFKVIVQVWNKGVLSNLPPGAQFGTPPKDTLVREIILANPCDLAAGDDLYITDTQYLIVKEA